MIPLKFQHSFSLSDLHLEPSGATRQQRKNQKTNSTPTMDKPRETNKKHQDTKNRRNTPPKPQKHL